MAKIISYEYKFDDTCTTTSLVSLSKPVITLQAFGTTGTTIYSYRVSALNSSGETLASDAVIISNGNSTLSSNNFIRISWQPNSYASSFKVYGRTVNNELFIATVNNTYFDDFGNVTPSGNLPTKDTSGYDPSKLNIGRFLKLSTSSINPEDNYISALPNIVYNFYENHRNQNVDFYHALDWGCHAIKYTDRYDIIVVHRYDQTGGNPRRYFAYTFDRFNWSFNYKGLINIYHGVNLGANDSDLSLILDIYNDEICNISNGIVTLINSKFVDRKVSVGSRIGFGSTDPEKITDWYQITYIGNNNFISLDRAITGISGTNIPFVVEELRIIFHSYGNLFYIKGLSLSDFVYPNNNFIFFNSDNKDRQKSVYRLQDAAVNTLGNYTTRGFAITDKIDNNTQYLYYHRYGTNNVLENDMLYRFNLRKDLNPGNGLDLNAFDFSTAMLRNYRYSQYGTLARAKPVSGPYKNKTCLLFKTEYEALLVSEDSINKNTKNIEFKAPILWQGIPTYRALDVRNSQDIAYDEYLDSFIFYQGNSYPVCILPNLDGTKEGLYYYMGGSGVGQYSTIGDPNYPTLPSVSGFNRTGKSINGVGYMFIFEYNSLPSPQPFNHFGVLNFGGDADSIKEYENRIICPEIETLDYIKFEKLIVNHLKKNGSENLDIELDPYNVFYRQQGIKDNSGAWIKIEWPYELSHISVKQSIQFMFNFKTWAPMLSPARIFSYSIVAEKEETLPKYFKFNSNLSSYANNIFGFEQIEICPTLTMFKITFRRTKDNKVIFTQDSSSDKYGNFQYLSTGNVWTNGIGPNTVGTMRRFNLNSQILSNSEIRIKIELV